MAKKNEPAGLTLRLEATARLRAILAGDQFTPITADTLADSRDRALANRLVTTALRRHGQINLMIEELMERGLPKRAGSFEAVLRLSLAQLVFLPDLGAHSAIHLAGECVKRDRKAQHLLGLMNAVLRSAQSNAARYAELPEHLLLPEHYLSRWRDRYGEDAVDASIAALLDGAPLDLTLRENDETLVEMLAARRLMADSVRVVSRDRTVADMPGYAEGQWWVQDVASAIPARLMKLDAGARVLDMCAAPGGKTMQLVKAGYAVTALDNDRVRAVRLRQNLERAGMSAEIIEDDAATFAPESLYDGVLLDAPCSATGTFRRHPEVLWRVDAGSIVRRVATQRAMIANAFRCLKPGGVLIYCTCSLEPEEGESQRAWMGDMFGDLEALPILVDEVPGLPEAAMQDGSIRTHAGIAAGHFDGGMDGFFVTRLRRSR
ncbi:MFS transporter [Devosia pacifica]|uniref:MFS transporter n=1 Tax=Devosia pacifica TaxID=1335967 RepID=A0A918S4M0_9HYPH|nr:RsmB/NOP family class I SAM-dependent RNA methyltransferase [Devosia pacifica]GHA24204.1 MFS transporter [Devosia pacifica]